MTLERYIGRQIVGPTVIAWLSLNLLFLLVQLLKVGEVVLGTGVGWSDVLYLSSLFLPGFATFTIPISVLTGVLLGFGRLAEDRELAALSGAGISPARLVPVPLCVGLLAAACAFVSGAWLGPRSAVALREAFADLAKRHIVAGLQPGRFFEEIPRVVLYPLRAVDGPGHFQGFLLYDHRPGRVRHALLARTASLHPVPGENRLVLELQDGQIHALQPVGGRYFLGRFDSAEIALDVGRIVRDRSRFMSEAESLELGELATAIGDENLPPAARLRRAAAFHRRLAQPFACLVFALLGTVLGASGRLMGRRRTLLAAVCVVAAYYFTMRLLDVLAEREWIDAAVSAWVPNALLATAALWQLLRASRRPV